MMDVPQMDEKLCNSLSEKRYTHSVHVAHTAVDMAGTFGADKSKAFIAGLMHDCAKGMDYKTAVEYAQKHGCSLDKETLNCPGIIHAPIGAVMAEVEYGIDDREILDAICYHTVARENATLLDKIIYVADMIEPTRDFEGVDKLRALAKKDINVVYGETLKASLKFNLEKGNIIHPNTLYAWNEIQINKMEENL